MTKLPQHGSVRGYVLAHGLAQLLFWSAFYYLLPALFAQIASETGWSVVHVSTTYTLAFLTWALSAPLIGSWIDAGHGPKVMRIGAMAGAILMLGMSQTSDSMIFRLLGVLLGVCMAATLYDPCFAVMMQRFEQDGPLAVASVTLTAGFATLLTFPLVFGLSLAMTWQQIMLVFAALAAVGVILLPHEGQTAPGARAQGSKMPVEKGPALIALSFGLCMMGHAILLFLLPVALVQSQSETNVAWLALAILGPAQIAGRIAWTLYSAAFSLQSCAIFMFTCLCLPALLLLTFGTAPLALCLALIIQGACYGVHTILRPALAQRYLRPSHLGRGLGSIAMVGLLMMALGPAAGGFFWTVAGISGLLGATLVLNALALFLGLMLRRTEPKGPLV